METTNHPLTTGPRWDSARIATKFIDRNGKKRVRDAQNSVICCVLLFSNVAGRALFNIVAECFV